MEASTERARSMRPALILAGTAALLYAADQATKALVAANVPLGSRTDVVGDLVQIWHVRNTGAAFSILPGATWLFIPMHLLAIGMVAYFFLQLRDRGPWIHVALGATLAGGLGNLTDRLRQGFVVDFVSVGLGDLRWPAFNVADPSLVIGILALVGYLTFVDGRRGGGEAAA